ncbi:ACP S-malonyltransferase [Dietzia maris]|uniref:ACP S-malonyltransferase n=1 Tax=Dietzia maris TaxID=37915 RepID=UPI00223BD15A|nr:ACP S-malonyltransferase [Dietzia maris]MCT1435604.1 ACP S-malonyltransferase [Dietzia maris]MCT1521427.1 ACP S-malonyltransferase [Dietzia maris]
MLCLTAPGQGSQKAGMLAPWLELPGASDRLDEWSASSGLDLERLGTTATLQEITDTAVTQPLVVASALLGAAELRRRGQVPCDTMVAGHSIGEIAALAIAGVVSEADALRLASVRGAAMSRACAERPTGMIAVLGGVEADVLLSLDTAGLQPANRNGAGQIVAAGPLEACDALEQNPPSRARLRRLEVAGAFHTHHMASAVDEVRDLADTIEVNDPELTLVSNADGMVVTSGRDALDRVVSQITHPVRWDLCTQTMLKLGVDAFIELPPSGSLVGLAKRMMRDVPRYGVTTPEDLELALESVPAFSGA